ncbi:MAG: NAD-dependent deacylase [Bacteroidetes bacterium]|nr:NAD-dependent deacylase [Bacteroidota bacterium]
MKKVVVLTGAGISAESGLKTFRDSDGLWENYRVEDVATPGAWQADFQLVLQFYNERRKQVLGAKPNAAHIALAELEKKYQVDIITQNIDDLHERAGSTRVLHLHGEILKSRSTVDAELVYQIEGWELKAGDRCEKGSQLRPHIVWFGEMVPELEHAAFLASRADIFLVIGTSLQVYPAAGLTRYAPEGIPKYYIDPKAVDIGSNFEVMPLKAGEGVPTLVKRLMI